MPPLPNTRHERFAQALFEGRPANAAYQEAGYKPHDGNCIRLRGNERVKARLAELQTAAARKSEVTVESLLDELEHARQRADGLDQLSAAVKAISEKAKISGLLVQRVEVGGAGAFDACESVADVADILLRDLEERLHSLDDRDRVCLINLLQRHADEVQEFLASIKARPVTSIPPRDIRRSDHRL